MNNKVIDSHNMTKTDTFTSSKSGTKTVAISMTVPKIKKGIYRVVFLTGPPDFQYQNEKTCSGNEELFYIENFVKN